MAVSAVVALLSYQSIASMVKVEQSVSEHQLAMQKLQRAIWWMEQDVIQMAPRAINDGMNGRVPALKYSQDGVFELSRLANFMTPNSQNGLLRVGYSVEDGSLYRLVWPVMDRVADTQPNRLRILRDVERVEWRFMDQANQWQVMWPPIADTENTNHFALLPKLVEMQLTLKNGSKIRRLFRGTEGVMPMFLPAEETNAEATP